MEVQTINLVIQTAIFFFQLFLSFLLYRIANETKKLTSNYVDDTHIIAKTSEHNNSIQIITQVLTEHRSKEFRTSLDWFWQNHETLDNTKGYYGHKDRTIVDHLVRISHFFDYVGLIIYHKLIDQPKMLISFFGHSAVNLFEKMDPFIEVERKKRDFKTKIGYQTYFYFLTEIVNKHPPEVFIDECKFEEWDPNT